MCFQTLSVALCAPETLPKKTFTCGRLHIVAADSQICEQAGGTCICFLGTCGTLDRIAKPVSMELSDLQKIRCAECTAEEDRLGEKRTAQKLLESKLLEKFAVPKPGISQYSALLSAIWQAPNCPFHNRTSDAVARSSTSDTGKEKSKEHEKAQTVDNVEDMGKVNSNEATSETSSEETESSLVNEDRMSRKDHWENNTTTDPNRLAVPLSERDVNIVISSTESTENKKDLSSHSPDATRLENEINRSMWAPGKEFKSESPKPQEPPQTPPHMRAIRKKQENVSPAAKLTPADVLHNDVAKISLGGR